MAKNKPMSNLRKIVVVASTTSLIILIGIGLGIYSNNILNAKISNDTADVYGLPDESITAAAKAYTEYKVNTSWPAENSTGNALSVAGYAYKITSDLYPSATLYYPSVTNVHGDNPTYVAPIHSVNTVQKIIQKVLYEHGFMLGGDTTDVRFDNLGLPTSDTLTQYVKNDARCTIDTLIDDNSVTITCYSPTIQNQLAAAAKPFVTAYIIANPSINISDITYGPAQVKSKATQTSAIGPSRTPGYDIAEAVFRFADGSHKIGLYYRKDSAPWQYLTNANDEFGFLCKTIEANNEATKALVGQPCLDPTAPRQAHVTQ